MQCFEPAFSKIIAIQDPHVPSFFSEACGHNSIPHLPGVPEKSLVPCRGSQLPRASCCCCCCSSGPPAPVKLKLLRREKLTLLRCNPPALRRAKVGLVTPAAAAAGDAAMLMLPMLRLRASGGGGMLRLVSSCWCSETLRPLAAKLTGLIGANASASSASADAASASCW